MKQRTLVIIIVLQILFNIILSSFSNVFAEVGYYTTEIYPCDRTRTQYVEVGRFRNQDIIQKYNLPTHYEVMYGCGMNCGIAKNKTLKAQTTVFLYAGGSYNFKYFVNACNVVTVKGRIKLYDELGNEVAQWNIWKR